MPNSINPYHKALFSSVRQAAQSKEAPARPTEPSRPPTAEQTAAPKGDGLSQVEQQMIDRYFPQSEAMTLRLYGADRDARTIRPGAVGSHLDVRG